MDLLSFIAELVKALAWPATLFLLIIMFKAPLLELIPGLRRLKYKGLELEFERKLERLETEAEQASLPPPEVPILVPLDRVQELPLMKLIEMIAPVSPRAAVVETWRQIELAISNAFTRIGRPYPRSWVITRLLLKHEGLLPQSALSILQDLRALRNQAVHFGLDLNAEHAVQYAVLAQRLIEALRSDGKGEKD